MKTERLLTIAVLLAGYSINAHAWRDVGNGGDHVAQDFATQATRAMDLLGQANLAELRDFPWNEYRSTLGQAFIHSAERVDIPDPTGSGGRIEVDVRNNPLATPQEIEVGSVRWKKLNESQKICLGFHEVLGLMRREENTYAESARCASLIAPMLEQRGPMASDLLFDQPLGENEGLDPSSAYRICTQLQELYRDRYFTVYCSYRSRDWVEFDWGVTYEPEAVFVGYTFREANDDYGIVYRRAHEPVYFTRWVPRVRVTSVINSRIYGLSVYGVGRLDQLPWKTIYNSRSVGDGEVELVFANRAQAVLTCREILSDKQYGRDGLKFERAKCFIEAADAGRGGYVFEIRTQNPYL